MNELVQMTLWQQLFAIAIRVALLNWLKKATEGSSSAPTFSPGLCRYALSTLENLGVPLGRSMRFVLTSFSLHIYVTT